jgi:hypothetical protein
LDEEFDKNFELCGSMLVMDDDYIMVIVCHRATPKE